jgi:hypothetical protein
MIIFTVEEKQRIAAIEKFFNVVRPQGLIEVRALGGKENGTIRHLHSSPRVLAHSAIMAEQTGARAPVYWSLNEINPESKYALINQSEKPLRKVRFTAGDKDILYRSTYLIDVDSVHPKGVCASDAKKAEALAVATRIIAFLTEHGWPEPVVIDSGNGIQLLYRGDHCNPNSEAWAHVLRHLAKLFSTPGAKVDTVVHNPARIARVPYTWNRKGESTLERPHRLATVLSYPQEWTPVNHGRFIYRLATEGGYTLDAKATSSKPAGDRFEVVDDIDQAVQSFIGEYPGELDVTGTAQKNSKTFFYLRHCPFAGRPHSKSTPAIILGDDFVGFSCFSDDCADYKMSDLRDLLAERTGHRSKVRFYKDRPLDLEKANKSWGDVDDLDNPEDRDRPLTAEELLAIVNEGDDEEEEYDEEEEDEDPVWN